MASSFQIHEDAENVGSRRRNKTKFLEIEQEIPRKRTTASRSALQPLNVSKPEIKRAKLCEVKEPKREIAVKVSNASKDKPRNEEQELDVRGLKLVGKEKAVKNKDLEEEIEELSGALFCVDEYKEDIWIYLKNLEDKFEWPKPNYMKKQLHLTANMRNILIDWLVSVADEYKMNEQTLHLSVNYIDRFLSRMSVVGEKFQLLGAAAMMLAGKLEEIYPPETKEWSYLTGNTFTVQQIVKMEQLLLKILKFDVQPPTMLTFIQYLCTVHGLDNKTMSLAMYFSELVLLEGEDYLHYLPSKLAAASIALARSTLRKRSVWPKKFATSSGYTLKQLSPIVQRQQVTFRDSPTKPQRAIQTKYEGQKYHKVATIKPRSLDLDLQVEE